MTVASFIGASKFVIRVIKSHHNNPSDRWVNNYEFIAQDAGTEGDLLALGVQLVNFEKAIHLNLVDFKQMSISTWEADSVPYNPLTFISTPLVGTGAVGEVTGMEPLNECLSVARVCSSGRFGHIFYRGALDGAEVFAPTGKAALVDTEEVQARITDALTASGLEESLATPGGGSFSMCLIPAAGTPIRLVVGLVAAGVSFLPLDHAWFNRTTT